MKTVTFSASKLFISKLNFTNKTAKKLSLSQKEGHAIADTIEATSPDEISLEAFSKAFVNEATTAVQKKLTSAIDNKAEAAAARLASKEEVETV